MIQDRWPNLTSAPTFPVKTEVAASSWEHQLIALMQNILQTGESRKDRTGTGTRALFGQRLDIDLKQGYPLVTTKKTPFQMVKSELLWFLEGSSDERRLAEIHFRNREPHNRTIWSDNAEAPYWKHKASFPGDLGRVYGVQWRSWLSHDNLGQAVVIDQIANMVDKIKNNPTDRRILVSAWNVAELDAMALPPCHLMFQAYVSNSRELSLQVYMRSVDVCLGLPFNIASYAMLTHMLAHVTGCTVGRLIMDLGDTHIYDNHLAGAELQVSRNPMRPPELWLNLDVTDINKFVMNDIQLSAYESHPATAYEMST